MSITIKITDPETAALLRQYRQYVDQMDGVAGSISQLAEGLMLGSLDEHSQFREWSNTKEMAA